MKKVLGIVALGLALCVVGVNDIYAATELYSTILFSDPNLQLYYRFEDDWADSSPNHYLLTPANSPTFVVGKYGKAGNFVSTSNQKATRAIAAMAKVAITTSQSWMFWIKMASFPANNYICGISSGGYWFFYTATVGQINTATGLAVGPQVGNLTSNVWGHVAFTYNSTTNKISSYFNGVIVQNNVTVTGSWTKGGGTFGVGVIGDYPGYGTFVIDELCMFDRVITATEIGYLTNRAPGTFSLTAPLHNTSTSNNKPAFSWGTSTDPESQTVSYTLKLSTNEGFTDTVYRTVAGLTGTSYTPVSDGDKIADGSYYWKVIASDGVMQTESTDTWRVTVDTQPPTTPAITKTLSDNQTGKIIEFKGTGENGTTLSFYDKNNNPVVGTTVWDGGTFTFTPTTPLDSGSPVYVESRDGATNTAQSKKVVPVFEAYYDISRDGDVFHGDTPGNSMRLEKDTSYEFDIAVNESAAVTAHAWMRYNSEYDGSGANAPTLTLSGLGITTGNTAAMTAPASYTPGIWEELTVSGTPSAKGVVTLKVETFSTADGAKAWVDDISVSQ